jgi:hypothetical protein
MPRIGGAGDAAACWNCGFRVQIRTSCGDRDQAPTEQVPVQGHLLTTEERASPAHASGGHNPKVGRRFPSSWKGGAWNLDVTGGRHDFGCNQRTIVVVVGAILFWVVDKYVRDGRLCNLLKILIVLLCLGTILARVLPLLGGDALL